MIVALHTSASEFGNVATIDHWHRGRGWSGIGYHFVVLNGYLKKGKYNHFFDGHIETGRPIDDDDKIDPWEIGAHIRGHNHIIGICIVGVSSMTHSQKFGIGKLLLQLREQFGKIDAVKQHSDYDTRKPFCAGLTDEDMKYFNKLIS